MRSTGDLCLAGCRSRPGQAAPHGTRVRRLLPTRWPAGLPDIDRPNAPPNTARVPAIWGTLRSGQATPMAGGSVGASVVRPQHRGVVVRINDVGGLQGFGPIEVDEP